MLSFGVLHDNTPQVGEYARFAEDRGFEYFYVVDSPIGWRAMSPYLTVAVLNTTKTKWIPHLGTPIFHFFTC